MDELNNEQVEQKVENQEVKVKKSFPVKKIVRAVLMFIIVAGVGVGVFYEYKYRSNLSNDLNDLQSAKSSTNSTVSNLVEENALKTTQINSLLLQSTTQPMTNTTTGMPVQEFAAVTFEKVFEDKNTALEDGYRFLIMDLKLENKTSNQIYFMSGEMKVKDKDNYEYAPIYSENLSTRDFIKKDAKVLFPENRIISGYANLSPGETVRLSVGYVLNRPGSEYKVYRADNLLKTINL